MNELELIKEKEEMIEKLNEEIKELRKNKGKWMPEMYEEYYFINLGAYVQYYPFENNKVDNDIIRNNKIFKTGAECKEYKEYLLAKDKAKKEFSDEEWGKKKIDKYCFYYDYVIKKIDFGSEWIYRTNIEHFRTEKECKEYIEKYEKFILMEMEIE